MKRDHKLVHKVLQFVEDNGQEHFKGRILIEGYERDDIIYHLKLLVDGGFIRLGSETLNNSGILLLSWKGCDYLDQIRSRMTAAKPTG